ncbi:MAG: ketol-acid reductoisomerase [Rubrobacteraceae bacterium]|uniref:ketol-acid reductoisomerase n=1 Tax=Rubrobacter naiadicus TaxID=1392641 RepID=UPI00235F6405|nr:ketol-acid reductoisomerase [Rubrobacter naiadicus]MBX6762453.1 ketol-acid reductoisomerase [Rubrobacteraceae bacterium]
MARIYTDQDADIGRLAGRTVAVIGYGNQGRAQALNMRDSGIEDIIVGNVRDESWDRAEEDGFPVMPIAGAARRGEVILLLIPDEVAPEVYTEHIGPHLTPGKTLVFASGYNVTFSHIEPPEGVDVVMVAPRMIGEALRALYLSGDGAPCFVDVHRDASGHAREDCLALAKAIGCTRAGAIEVGFEQETWMDLLAEQGIWPLIMRIFLAAFELEVEAGIPPEAALLELYVSKEPAEIFERAAEVGFFEQLRLHSHTSQYGQLSRLAETDRVGIESFLREALEERIRSGSFDAEWSAKRQEGEKALEELYARVMQHPMVRAEASLQEMLGGKEAR